MALTFGAELEFADVRYGAPLPEGCAWNRQDYSVVNSNGVANCPVGRYYGFGGEINTRPTNTVQEQVQVFEEILASLDDPRPAINYRCNLHIHVGVKGLKNNLEALKKFLRFINDNQRDVWALVDPIPTPMPGDYKEPGAYQGAMKRCRRRHMSHQYELPPERYNAMMEAKTTEEFYLGHFIKSKAGVPQKHLTQRCGINLRSLWENPETIEYRHFAATLDPKQFQTCVQWASDFTRAALDGILDAHAIYRLSDKNFPKFLPYEHHLEVGYQATSHSVEPKERAKAIERLVNANAPADV